MCAGLLLSAIVLAIGGEAIGAVGFALAGLAIALQIPLIRMGDTWRRFALDSIERHNAFVDEILRAARQSPEDDAPTPTREDRP
jgi:hypothetical protein